MAYTLRSGSPAVGFDSNFETFSTTRSVPNTVAGDGLLIGVTVAQGAVTITNVAVAGEGNATPIATPYSQYSHVVQWFYIQALATGGTKNYTINFGGANNANASVAFCFNGPINLISTSFGAGASRGITTPGDEAFIAAICWGADSKPGVDTADGFTGFDLTNIWNIHNGQYKLNAGGVGTTTVDAPAAAFMYLVAVSQGAGVPTITDVGDEQFYSGETGIVVTGTAYGTSGNTVIISPTNNKDDPAAVTQTLTAQGSTTSVTMTAVRGSLPLNTNLYMFITNDVGQTNASGYIVQFTPRLYLRETLGDLADNPVANATGLTAIVYHSIPTGGSPNPAQVIGGVTSDASGNFEIEISRGSLTVGQSVILVLLDSSPQVAGVLFLVPDWE